MPDASVRPLPLKALAAITVATFLVVFLVLEVVDPRWIGALGVLGPATPAAGPGAAAVGSPGAASGIGSGQLARATPTLTPAAPDTPTLQGRPEDESGLRRAVVSNTDGEGARVRLNPDSEAEVLAVLQEGAVVQLAGRQTEAEERLWVEVRTSDGQRGWMAGDFLREAQPTPGP
jgi:hypothetical protein